MAKVSMFEREKRRQRLVNRYNDTRKELKAKAREAYMKGEIPWEVQQQLQKIPRNANPTRLHRRCRLCGRSHGVYRKLLGRAARDRLPCGRDFERWEA